MDTDGITDSIDNCPDIGNPDQTDSDNDGLGNPCDNCPLHANADQADSDHSGVGDVCEPVSYEEKNHTVVPDIILKPNPASDFVIVQANYPVQVTLHNVLGINVKSKFIHQGDNVVIVEDLPPGLYIVRFGAERTIAMKKIIVQHP